MPSLRIASPCTASWESMRVVVGGRHCASCDRQVQDFTRMTERETVARALLFGGSGLCGRLLVDAEGNARFRLPATPKRGRARVLPVVAAAAALGAGCGAHEPEPATAPPASELRADAPIACEPTAKIVEPATAPTAPVDGATAAVPRRVIVAVQGDVQVMRHVTFKPGASALDAEDALLLQEVAKILLERPDIRHVSVEGHADDKESKPKEVSLARATVVISFLVSRGVRAERLEPLGVGAERPLEAGSDVAAREKNRRVELRIVPEP